MRRRARAALGLITPPQLFDVRLYEGGTLLTASLLSSTEGDDRVCSLARSRGGGLRAALIDTLRFSVERVDLDHSLGQSEEDGSDEGYPWLRFPQDSLEGCRLAEAPELWRLARSGGGFVQVAAHACHREDDGIVFTLRCVGAPEFDIISARVPLGIIRSDQEIDLLRKWSSVGRARSPLAARQLAERGRRVRVWFFKVSSRSSEVSCNPSCAEFCREVGHSR